MKFYQIICQILFGIGFLAIMFWAQLMRLKYMVKIQFKANSLDEAKEMYIGYMAALDERAADQVKGWCRWVSGINLH